MLTSNYNLKQFCTLLKKNHKMNVWETNGQISYLKMGESLVNNKATHLDYP